MSAPTPAALRQSRLLGYACAACVMLLWAGFALALCDSARAGSGMRLTPWDLGALRFAISDAVAAALWSAGVGRGLTVAVGVRTPATA